MKSVCLILLALALYCDAAATRQKRQAGCACDGTTVETNADVIIGECLYANADGHFCYVSDKACASAGDKGKSSRFTNKWVSYELCNCENNADCNEQIIKSDE